MKTLSIKLKVTLIASGALWSLLLLASIIQLHYLKREMKNVLADQQFTLVSRVADDLDQKLSSNLRALVAVSTIIPADIANDDAQLESNLANRTGLQSLFNDLFIISPKGDTLVDLPKRGRKGVNIADQENFRMVMMTRKPYVSKPFLGKVFSQPIVTMSAPILDAGGNVVGILTGSLKLLETNVLGNMSNAKVGKTGSFAVLTKDRMIVMSSDKDRIMTTGPPPGTSPYFDHATAGEEGSEEATNSRGLQAIFSYKPLASVPWVLVAALPVEEAYAPIELAQTRIEQMTALLALLVAPIAWFGATYLLRPLTRFRDAIRDLRKTPNEMAVVPVGGRDEIGDLAQEFNELMAERRAARLARDRAAEEVVEKNIQLTNANEVKTRFLATMSHELRTPLNAIIGFTGTVLMRLPGPLTEEQDKQLRTVQRSAKHLLSLINDLLDVAKIDAGKTNLEIRATDCQELLEEIVASLLPQAVLKGLDLVIRAPDGRVMLLTDRTKLGQILINLVQNAIKFTQRGSVSIELSHKVDEKVVEFAVTDTGVGIDADGQPALFEAFYRAGGANSTSIEGTGLGLYVSRKLAQLLGGTITMRSDVGVGSVFTLVLPIRPQRG